jgi:hypothetical protein
VVIEEIHGAVEKARSFVIGALTGSASLGLDFSEWLGVNAALTSLVLIQGLQRHL